MKGKPLFVSVLEYPNNQKHASAHERLKSREEACPPGWSTAQSEA